MECAFSLIVRRRRGMPPTVSYIGSVYTVGIILFLSCRIISMAQKLSTYFHFLCFQPVGVVIMEHCGVADSLLQLSSHSARSGYISFSTCYQREVAVSDHRTGPARSSLFTLVSRGHLGQPNFDLQLLPKGKFNQNMRGGFFL